MNDWKNKSMAEIDRIAIFFASKKPQEINFADADKFDYELF